jgi:hypothetical protein
MNRLIVTVGFLCFFWLGLTQAHAEEKRGWLIVPSLTYSAEYSSNFFLTETHTDDDFLNIISPGLLLRYNGNKFKMNNQYSFFLTQSLEDTTYRRYNHRFNHTSRFKVGRLITLNLDNQLADTDDPTFIQRGFFTGRSEYLQNILNPSTQIIVGKNNRLTLDYYNQYLNFQDSNDNDLMIHGGGLQLERQLTPRQQLGLGYAARIASFSTRADNNYLDNIFTLNWKYQATRRLYTLISGGAQWRRYTDTVLLSDFVDGYGALTVNYTTPRDSTLQLSSKYGHNNLGVDSSFRVLSTDLSVRYRILPRFYASGSLYYQFEDYVQPTGVVAHMVGFSPALQYRLYKWIYVEGAYDLLNRDSNLAENSHLTQTFLFKLGFLYGKTKYLPT